MGVGKTVVLAILCIFILTACSEETKFVCNDPYIQVGAECCLDQDSNNICDKDEEEPEEVIVIEEPELEEDDNIITGLLEEANARIKSISYYTRLEKAGQVRFSIKGNKIRIQPTKPLNIDGNIIDVIFMNDLGKNATGMCILTVSACRNQDPIALNYFDYRERTPLEWLEFLEEFEPEEIIKNAEIVDSQVTDMYTFRLGRNKRTKLYIDSEFKIPLKVVELREPFPVTHLFKDLSINTVSEKDLNP